ncbi:MAG: class I SAM-dependent methyltransferase [Armatimonadota bacterium]
MDLETAKFLLSPQGSELLREAATLQGSFLSKITILRRKYPSPIASAAIELLELRKRAESKFNLAHEMFFTREALEQASSETISRYRAERYKSDAKVLDLACGIGGDTIGLAERCLGRAVDKDPVRILMAERNLEVYGLSNRVKFICADVTSIPLDAEAAFLDPSRRANGKRVVHLDEMNPSPEFIHHLISEIPDCAIKLSPAMEYSELESLQGEIEFISEHHVCKEALVWLGNFKTTHIRATVLPEKASLVSDGHRMVGVRPPGKYIYEPDPCVVRAHLVEKLAWEIGAWKIDEQIAFLGSTMLVHTPFASPYEIIESLPFNLKELKKRLRGLDAGRVVIKKRGVAYSPVEIEKRLNLTGNHEFVLILSRLMNTPWVFICLPAG